ncbi:type IV secretory system conjugative DNA transfer family protein [uncultured Roseobacter sp.]|uniref:type IV secretory system conjugative DNA transfer family protein n=1 Tax=uncultured Roseobacter sp. TaxID=114847 RepID=UPI0026146CB1|nr:type IV secretory system conjugative DNA transfer family protein [uncultured Roseobacter sp.]
MAQYIRPEAPSAGWLNPAELAGDDFTMKGGRLFLGRTKERLIGIDDNRHVATIAGSRAGKSVTSLMSNLLTWEGSTIVIDPKGELATNTALHRKAMGQEVYILDPFGEVKGSDELNALRTTYNPFAELRAAHADDVNDEAATVAEATIVTEGNTIDHWTMSAKNLIRGLSLYALHKDPENASLVDVRKLLTLPLETPDGAPEDAPLSMLEHFEVMLETETPDGVLAGVGGSMLGKPDDERGSIISTAIEQTAFLDSPPLRAQVGTSGLPSLRILKQKPATIYLVLPASRMSTHFRWFRILLTQAMTALEREKNATPHPVLFILEEFPTLGYMRQIEAAAGLMAGYDVKLWTVMQDLSQIQALYPKSWETFLGNAGIIEAFGNTDMTTLEYLSKRLGTSLSVQIQPDNPSLGAQQGGAGSEREQIVTVPLMAPYEIALAFARKKGNKLILSDAQPFALRRVFWKDLLDGT